MAGHFTGPVKVTWLEQDGDDRDMRLDAAISFVDQAGLKWTAKKGGIVNGASIPKVFWTSFGSPFIGDYRRASVLHDYFCDIRTRTSEATHRMFYEACIVGGVGTVKAKTMYLMVATFGPSWTVITTPFSMNGLPVASKGDRLGFRRTMADGDLSRLTRWIEVENPGLDRIDEAIRSHATQLLELPPVAQAPVAIEAL